MKYSPYKRGFKNVLILWLASIFIFGCSRQPDLPVYVSPAHFKIQTSFVRDSRGILVNVYTGKERKHHVLCLDNYSPSWIKSSAIQGSSSFAKLEGTGYKTSTADGSQIQGDVSICDSLLFQNIAFRQVPFYLIPDKNNDNKNDDGVLGIDVMSKGIWKIDFSQDSLSFASDIDSFPEINKCEILPATFTAQSITVAAKFGDGSVKDMPIDLGYNGDMLVPMSDFKRIAIHKKPFTHWRKFSTPGHQDLVNSISVFDTVSINHNYFITLISSSETVNERLIGLKFFERFHYVIFDFIHQKIYVPKKVW